MVNSYRLRNQKGRTVTVAAETFPLACRKVGWDPRAVVVLSAEGHGPGPDLSNPPPFLWTWAACGRFPAPLGDDESELPSRTVATG